MTIHQAKGLEFPVVILPFMDTPLRPNVREKIWYSFQNSTLAAVQWGWFNFSNELRLCGNDAEALYQEHLLAKKLDALNVLYVALTRPKNQLYIITQAVKKGEIKTYSVQFLNWEFLNLLNPQFKIEQMTTNLKLTSAFPIDGKSI
jgi:ATP-dependent exoDNAse (exonuclease V) beta subunit